MPLFFSLFLFLVLLLSYPPSVYLVYSSSLYPSDLQTLLQIKTQLSDLPGSNFFSTWEISTPDPCSSFAGVFCSPELDPATPFLRVSSLTLGTGLADSPGLRGTLSPALANLTALAQLLVHPGRIFGPIPPQVGNLNRLLFLSITHNLISGPIPDSLARLPQLHTLDLGHNQLTGSVPPHLTSVPSLKVLILASNRLSGQVPPVRSELLHLDVQSNVFSGPLPELPSTLRYFSASKNEMWGPIDNVRDLPDLSFLDLSMNRFSGSIPESLFGGTGVVLLLQRNNFSGCLPMGPTFGMIGSTVDLSHNGLTGELSPVLAGTESVFLNHNQFTGKVPVEYARSVYGGTMKTLYLQHNYLTGFPVPAGSPLPESGALCISYNCMVPPVGSAACPASTGNEVSRPSNQCSLFNVSYPNTNG